MKWQRLLRQCLMLRDPESNKRCARLLYELVRKPCKQGATGLTEIRSPPPP